MELNYNNLMSQKMNKIHFNKNTTYVNSVFNLRNLLTFTIQV